MNPTTLLLFGSLAWLLWPRRQRNPRRRRRRNIEAFTDQHGIHPIRGSRGYDESILGDAAEERARDAQAERYRGIKRERDSSVDRPPWAVGVSNAALEKLAREHGQVASSPGWWERAGLYRHRGGGGAAEHVGRYDAEGKVEWSKRRVRPRTRDKGELEDMVGYLRLDKARPTASHTPRAKGPRKRYRAPEALPW